MLLGEFLARNHLATSLHRVVVHRHIGVSPSADKPLIQAYLLVSKVDEASVYVYGFACDSTPLHLSRTSCESLSYNLLKMLDSVIPLAAMISLLAFYVRTRTISGTFGWAEFSLAQAFFPLVQNIHPESNDVPTT